MKVKKILIFGAGAIGRGFIAPLLQNYNYKITFVDKDKKLIKKIREKNSFKIAITNENNYQFKKIKVDQVFHINQKFNIKNYDIVFCCVGPKQCLKIAHKFKGAKTVISCENDIFSVDYIKKLSGNKNVFFGIPDVITSNTASPDLLKIDQLMTVTEKGILVLQQGSYKLPKKILQVRKDYLHMHWRCKLFIHNAPHAMLAYLGYLKGYKYIHEAMRDPKIKKIIINAMNEITKGVINSKYVEKKFAEKYKQKEIKRFSNKLLFDPILRVAREPLRKLGKDNRIILALRIAQWNNKFPKYTAIGLIAALNYYNKKDPESVHLQKLRKKFNDSEVLEKICGIEQTDPLNNFCLSQDLKIFNKREF